MGGGTAGDQAAARSLPTQFPPPTSPRWGEAMAMRDVLFKKSPKCPRSIDFEAEIPRHPTGKLYKRLLKERYWVGHPTRLV